MNGAHFCLKLFGLSLALMFAPPSWSQPPAAPEQQAHVCKIYQLRDFAESEDLCQWIADAIPDVVQPGTWRSQPRYNAKLALLAICQTPTAHAEVAEFLKNLKDTVQASAKEAAANKTGTIVPAQYTPGVCDCGKAGQPAPANKSTYLVPAPLQQPKHLFHFIMRFEGSGMDSAVGELAKKLTGAATETPKEDVTKGQLNQLLHLIVRYEGDGIIDANVVEFFKAYVKAGALGKEAAGDPLVGETNPAKGPGNPVGPAPAPPFPFGRPDLPPAPQSNYGTPLVEPKSVGTPGESKTPMLYNPQPTSSLQPIPPLGSVNDPFAPPAPVGEVSTNQPLAPIPMAQTIPLTPIKSEEPRQMPPAE